MPATKPAGLPLLLKHAPSGANVKVDKLPHGGSLQARMLSKQGIQSYWRYSHGEHTHRKPIGVYDPAAPPKQLEPTARGFSVAGARERCRELVPEHQKHRDDGGLRESKNIERECMTKAREEQHAAKAAAVERAKHSLGALLDEYIKL